MRHETHQMHENSLIAFNTLDKHTRRLMVLACYERSGYPLTDRQVCQMLGFSDLNAVRPRITEAVQSGELVEVGKVRETGRPVRMCQPRPQFAVVDNQMEFC